MKTRSSLLHIRELPVALLLAITIAWLWCAKPIFHTFDNLAQVGQEAGLLGIMACGQTAVILTSGIDLSVGAILALSAVVAGSLMMAGCPVPVAMASGVLAGGFVGWFNGALVTFRKLPPMLVTLAGLLLYRSATSIFTNAVPFNQLPRSFTALGVGFIPFSVFVVTVILFALVLNRSRFGRHVFAVGGSEQAARLSGIRVDHVLRWVYLLSGACAGLSGLLMSAAANNAQWNLADGWELEVIAATVVGGVRMSGGEGSVVGAALGALLIVVLRNALFLYGMPVERYGLVTGAVIVIAALAEQMRRSRSVA